MEVGDITLIIEVASILLVVLAALAVSLFYIDKNRKLRRGQEFLKMQIEIQEQSFDKIYKEIHDNIGQSLSLVKLNLNTVESNLSKAANEKIRYSKELVGKAITDLRKLSKDHTLQIITDLGLGEAIKRELLLTLKSENYITGFKQKGEPIPLERQKEFILFGIFQEILNIVVTYLHAKRICVTLKYHPKHLDLVVSHDGAGFNIQNESPDSPLAQFVDNMQTKAILIDAALHFTKTFDEINAVRVELPAKKHSDVIAQFE